jgi:hypothetical protein
VLAEARTGFMTTSALIAELEHLYPPEGKDAEVLTDRSDTYFSQKVRNMVSHRSRTRSHVKRGFIAYHKDRRGFSITDVGRLFLAKELVQE